MNGYYAGAKQVPKGDGEGKDSVEKSILLPQDHSAVIP